MGRTKTVGRVMRRLCCVVCCVVAFAPWHAATAAAITFEPAAQDGGYVTIPVTIRAEGREGVAALQFDVAYDPAMFELTEIQPGAAAEAAGKYAVSSDLSAGVARVIVAGMNQDTIADGDVVHLVFAPLTALDGGGVLSPSAAVVSDPFGNPINVETLDLSAPLPTASKSGDDAEPASADADTGGGVLTNTASPEEAYSAASGAETPTIMPFGTPLDAPMDALEGEEEAPDFVPQSESQSRSYASQVGRYLDRANRLRETTRTGASNSSTVLTGQARGGGRRIQPRETSVPTSLAAGAGGTLERGQDGQPADLDMFAAAAPGTLAHPPLRTDGRLPGGAVVLHDAGVRPEFSWHMPALLGAVLTAAAVLCAWAFRPRRPARTR